MAGKKSLTDLEALELKTLIEKRSKLYVKLRQINIRRKEIKLQLIDLRDVVLQHDFRISKTLIRSIKNGSAYN